MWAAFSLMEGNLGTSIEVIILLLIFISGVIMASRSFKLAVVWWFLTSGLSFIGFYQWSLNDVSVNWSLSLVFFFMSFIMMSLTLYSINKSASIAGGGVF